MKTSNNGIAFTKDQEGFQAVLGKDRGRDVIGFGTDLTPEQAIAYVGKTITMEQGDMLMMIRVSQNEDALNKSITVEVNQNQFDALQDFVYNEGREHFETSTLLKLLNSGDTVGAIAEFPKWVYSRNPETGVEEKLQDLVGRRNEEVALFVTPVSA